LEEADWDDVPLNHETVRKVQAKVIAARVKGPRLDRDELGVGKSPVRRLFSGDWNGAGEKGEGSRS
jgi:hypothetical protein